MAAHRETTRSAAAIRVRTIRKLFDVLDEDESKTFASLLTDKADAVAQALDVPRLALELIYYHHHRRGARVVSFQLIEELEAWMQREGVRRDDVTGERAPTRTRDTMLRKGA